MYHLGLQKWGDRESAGASSHPAPALGSPTRCCPCRAPQDRPVTRSVGVLAGVWTPVAFPLLSWGRALGSAPPLVALVGTQRG